MPLPTPKAAAKRYPDRDPADPITRGDDMRYYEKRKNPEALKIAGFRIW